jgi:parallel beta-helix repeat protein
MRHRPALAVATTIATLAVGALTVGPATAATTYAVDGSASACSDTGTGTASQPFCTIGAATKRALVAGDVVQVAPGTYREQVTVPASGAAGSPITFTATGPGVLVLGTRDLGGATWTAADPAAPATSWRTAYAPPSTPRQVFLAGTRLTAATSLAAMTARSWFYDTAAKVLTVDLGGPSPAGQSLEAGAQSYGVNVATRHDVVISGISTRGANFAGLRVNGSSQVDLSGGVHDQSGSNGVLVETSTNVSVRSLAVTTALSTGIKASGSAGVAVRDCTTDHNGLHGISVVSSPQAVVQGNLSHDNVVTTGTATAAGIDVAGSSTDVRVVGNTSWANQDSGVQLASGASGALVARNVSHHNGDHGLHDLGATNVSFLNNSATQNRRDGIAVESSATGARLANNVLTDNGAPTATFNLFVDTGSMPGLVADYDLAYNSAARNSVRVGATAYRTLRDYATASGQEANGLALDPGFADVPGGDLALTGGSPAVDSADAGVAGFVGDAPWNPVDDPASPDRGAGTPTYADRGALEFVPAGATNHPPRAALFLDPASTVVPPAATVTVNASGSSDVDPSGIASYSFDFGDGTTSGPLPGPVTSHTFNATGSYTVTVTVTDAAGATATASATETVSARPGAVLEVDRGSTACSDAGPATSAQPLCTINAGTRRALAGDTVHVAAGTYSEQVTVPHAGQAGAPVSILGDAGARVTGADPVTGAAGARGYGFLVRAVSNVVLDGFTVVDSGINGIRLDTTGNVTVSDVDVSRSGSAGLTVEHSSGAVVDRASVHEVGTIGIRFLDATDSEVRSSQSHHNGFHGISVQGSTRVAVRDSSAYANLKPSARSATGIDVSATSVGTVVEGNRTWDNDDSGIEVYTGSQDTVVRRNATWHNGDHGIDDFKSTGTVIVSNTVVANATAGINLEGGSTGGTVRDNLTQDNAVGSTRTVGEIRVDAASVPGTTLERDLVFQRVPAVLYQWNGKKYTSRATFTAASGQEARGLVADPLLKDLAGNDFSLGAGSPAVDAADAGVTGWRATDLLGSAPVDDPTVTDTGSGSPSYADLGALERVTTP